MTLPLDDVTFTKYEFVELIKKVAELIIEKNKLLEMLKSLTEHGMVAAPGPHYRWPDEYYDLFTRASKLIAEIEHE